MTVAAEASDLPQEICERYLFEPGNEQTFCYVLGGAANAYAAACDEVDRYRHECSPEAQESLRRMVRALPEFQGILEDRGEEAHDFIEAVAIAPVPEAKSREFLLVRIQHGETALRLAGLVSECQAFMKEQFLIDFQGNEDRADRASWTATWTRFRDTLQPMGGTVLAEVVDLFDGMVAWEYPETYDHRDEMRGSQARTDIAASTFYEAMRPHLTRSIVPRSDQWHGR